MAKEIEKKKEAGLPTVGLADLMGDSGKGFENVTAKDIAIPFFSILQSLSPQTKKGDPMRIDGAEAGDFHNSVTNAIYKGETGIRVIPVGFHKKWVEWATRESGGGFIKQWDSEAILLQTKRDEKNRDILPTGHMIVETAYHYVMLLLENGEYQKAVIGMKSTQLKKSRQWNTRMGAIQLSGEGGRKFVPPSFSHSYLLTSINESNKAGSWWGWEISEPKLIAFEMPELYQVAKRFNEEIGKGLVKVQEPQQEGGEPQPASSEANF